jgi:hypothetical protein
LSNERRSEYLWEQVLYHLRLFFDEQAAVSVNPSRVRFGPYSAMISQREPVVAIPNDIPYNIAADDAWQVPFNGTTLTVWNRTPFPSSDGWHAEPNEKTPLWYIHASGTHLPAWNLFGNLFGLLTGEEERQTKERDRHGRFIGSQSPRAEKGLLAIPAFNEAVAALAAACVGMQKSGRVGFHLDRMIRPPAVILSHDCDILLGNDRWTQAVRAARIVLPLLKLRAPRIANLWWVMRNYVRPRDFYFDNVAGMINLERQFGFTSTYYLLNGTAGRFGARSGSAVLPELIAMIPKDWPLGVHYNYDTFLNAVRFRTQLSELTNLLGYRPALGRAHYLRFDSEQSPAFLAEHEIQCDESAGFSDRVGYRCGVGGCFRPYDLSTETAIRLREIPMNIMDATLLTQFGDRAFDQFETMLKHLGKIGGALSLNVHPGVFFNPELPRLLGFYHRLLRLCRDCGAIGMSAARLLDRILSDSQCAK